jgi:conjugal transfer pilus assembly protein TraD
MMERERQRRLTELRRAGVIVLFFALLIYGGSGANYALAPAAVLAVGVGGRVWWRQRQRQQRMPAKPFEVVALEDGLILGVDTGEAVVLSDEQIAAHGVILGAAGSGKTTTLWTILGDAVRRGMPVVAIDLKDSTSFYNTLYDAANAAGRPLHYWRFDGIGHWNPLQYGDATELKDKLISFERFSEPHYQRAAERYLQTAIQVLQQARPDKPVTLAAVVALLDPQRLQELFKYLPREMLARVGPYVSGLNRDQKSAVSGLQSRLALISESAVGQYLQPEESYGIDLRRALCGGNEVVYFGLNSSRYGKLAAQVAALVIQDLTTIAGYRGTLSDQPLALIGVDEFSALDADNILSLIARSREPLMSVLLATQEMADLERLAAGFRDQVLGIVGMTIAHRQSVPASAEMIARMIGTQTVWKYTEAIHRGPTLGEVFSRNWKQPTALGTRREVEEFRIHPNIIKDLPVGRAVLITKIPTASARIVQAIPGPRRPRSNGR